MNSIKVEKNCRKITVATLMHPFQCDLRRPVAKDNRTTRADAAGFRANPTVAATVAQASLLFSDQ